MSHVICVLLWAVPGRADMLGDYETAVLDLLPQHGGKVLSRVCNIDANVSPTEVQILELASEAALASFMADPLRLSLGPLRDQCVARTEVIRVRHVLD